MFKKLMPKEIDFFEYFGKIANTIEMRELKNRDKIQKHCTEINRLENKGDSKLRIAITRLFAKEKDPINIIKWKEIYENI